MKDWPPGCNSMLPAALAAALLRCNSPSEMTAAPVREAHLLYDGQA